MFIFSPFEIFQIPEANYTARKASNICRLPSTSQESCFATLHAQRQMYATILQVVCTDETRMQRG